MTRRYLPVWATPLLALLSIAVGGACAKQEDQPFPHLLDEAGTSGVAGTPEGDLGGGGSAGAAVASAGGGAAPVSEGGAPAAGSAGMACTGGAASCVDGCPDDPLKMAPGTCGCGKPDTDTDADGTPDCKDECPAAKGKTKKGCGCDVTTADETTCQALLTGLVHRYAFTGSGTAIKDSKGAADGVAVNVALSNTGSLEFTTGDQYADLPNGIVSKLTNVTLEAWVTWQGGNNWQRVFDLGEDSTGTENSRSTGRSYIFVSPHGDGNFVRAVYRKPGAPEVVIDAAPSLASGAAAQVALVLDDDHDLMTLYVNGASVGSAPFVDHLSYVNDINNWLGRSQFMTDPAFAGSIQEFRMYAVALSAAQLAFSYSKGADAAYFTP